MPSFLSGHKSPILIKALLGTTALVAASVMSLSALFLLRHQAAFQRQVELRAESLAASLAAQSQFALLVSDRAELDRAAGAVLGSNADVLYVRVDDASGKHIAGAARAPITRATQPPGASDIKLRTIRKLTAGPEAEQCVEAGVPVIPQAEGGVFGLPASQTQVLGRIRVGMSLRSQRALFDSTLRYVIVIGLVILVAAFTIAYVQTRNLLRPLVDLARVAELVGAGGEDGVRAIKRGDDGIGILVDRFNGMLDQVAERTRELHEQVDAKERARAELVEAQQRLIDLSRQSGMAEIATGVLHNVGNVLNSVNVSAMVVADKVKESRIGRLAALVEVLQQHPDDLDEFLRHDPKGQRVLPYLANLSSHLERERTAMLKELELLTGHIGHIKQIVATQQNYGKVSGLIERLSPVELMEDALSILRTSFQRHDILLVREFEENLEIESDKHQILQILLNLLRNAKQAVNDGGREDKVVRLRISRHGEDRVRIEVKDNGIGIPPENLTRIFAHGFTTKSTGHGFGLHSGALAAKGLGGSLMVESEGPGQGAAFTLELPLAAMATRSEACA